MKKAFTPTFRISVLTDFQKNFGNKLTLSIAVVVLSSFSFSSFRQILCPIFKLINHVVILQLQLKFSKYWLLFKHRKMMQIC